MTGEQVVRILRAVGQHLAAFADDLEQITTATDRAAVEGHGYVCPQCGPDPRGATVHAEREHTL